MCLPYADMNVTNKHPVTCLERAAMKLTVKEFFFISQAKEMRHLEVKRSFLLSFL